MGSISMNNCKNCGTAYCFGRCSDLKKVDAITPRIRKEASDQGIGVAEYQKIVEEIREDYPVLSKMGVDKAVDHPAHYNTGAIEVITAIEDWKLGFHLGNVVKYIARADHKEKKLEDLKKARWYLDREIRNMEMTVNG